MIIVFVFPHLVLSSYFFHPPATDYPHIESKVIGYSVCTVCMYSLRLSDTSQPSLPSHSIPFPVRAVHLSPAVQQPLVTRLVPRI